MPNLSYEHCPSDQPLLGETIGVNLRRTIERFGDREALVVRHQGTAPPIANSGSRSGWRRAAFWLAASKTGDRVGVWSPNRFEWVVLQYATSRIGAILVNINPAYKTVELEYALNKSGVSVLCLARGFRQADYLAMLARGPRSLHSTSRSYRARHGLGRAPSSRLRCQRAGPQRGGRAAPVR